MIRIRNVWFIHAAKVGQLIAKYGPQEAAKLTKGKIVYGGDS